MALQRLTDEKKLDSAKAVLLALDPAHGELWEESRRSVLVDRGWVFRGMWNANYDLRPTALRGNAFGDPFVDGATPAEIQRDLEDSALSNFCTSADQLGFHIPSDRPELRDPREAPVKYNPFQFPAINRLHMAALAQHYGVPTRLLDWSRKPLVAAYFAVKEVCDLTEAPEPKQCVIWALDGGFVQQLAKDDVREGNRPTGRGESRPTIILITAPTASNAHLAAQGGVFTLVQPRSGDPHPLPDIDAVIQSLEETDVPEGWRRKGPVLVKYTFPVKVARHLLRLLAANGIHAASVFPGLHSIRTMQEERKHFHRMPAPPLVAAEKVVFKVSISERAQLEAEAIAEETSVSVLAKRRTLRLAPP